MFLVTGGHDGSDNLDSTETFDPLVGSWTTSRAKLPRPMRGLMAENIFLFGKNKSIPSPFILSLNTSTLTKSLRPLKFKKLTM